MIEEKSKQNVKLRRKDKKELRETKFLQGLERTNAECLIFGDQVSLITLTEEEPVSILIKNKEIADLLRLIFKELWNKI